MSIQSIYILLVMILLSLFGMMVVQKRRNKDLSQYPIGTVIMICLFMATVTFFQKEFIFNHMNLGTDPLSLYLFLTVIGLSVLNMFIYKGQKKPSS
ncbi:MAG TPA: hypothetical protein VK119_04350 [Bacillota bacterium]|nr:hypothetical protein [Bacillota bacterium]